MKVVGSFSCIFSGIGLLLKGLDFLLPLLLLSPYFSFYNKHPRNGKYAIAEKVSIRLIELKIE